MTLKDALDRFDGKHTHELKEALPLAESQPAELMKLCQDPKTEVAATWVAKALIEQGRASFAPQDFFASLPKVTAWDAQLHILQCVQYAPDAAVEVVAAARTLIDSKKTLTRVWALDAFVRIADLRPEHQKEARALMVKALDGDAASLRARARQLQKVVNQWE
ncbi:MAG: hypothetical protein AAF393_03960 [Pseudomonadota bacterium]